jgi:hypothetical protein
MIGVGTRVLLKHCPHGHPGTVVRIERSRAVVLWSDLDYLARHPQGSLMESPQKSPQSPSVLEVSL